MASKKAKGNRVQVILECTEMKNSGLPGTSRYVTTKNRKNTPERMELKKYNPILKRLDYGKENGGYPPRRFEGRSRIHKGYQNGEEPQDWCLHFR